MKKWWKSIEVNWRAILISNIVFNQVPDWNLIDCDLEAPAKDNEEASSYLLSFSNWINPELTSKILSDDITEFELVKHLNSIKFLWCSGIIVSTIEPFDKLPNLISTQIRNLIING